jgi:C4-dicarboxylate-specific signal transduction histidine kinase
VESVPAGRPAQVVASKDDSIPHSLEIDLTEIVQFTRIALRRIERGKTDADKFATLFRAIQQKAQAARTALATVAADVDIYEHVANVLMQADTELQANGIRIVQRLAKDLPATDVDPIVLEQILHELLHEAIEATLEASQDVRKPIVLIGCATQDGGIELSITDGGAEVSLAEIQGIFESLLAEDKATAEVPLIMASELIAAQGGRLWCAPNPAGGSIRYLRLPGVAV